MRTEIFDVLLPWFFAPSRWYREAFVTSVKKSQNVTAENVAHVFHSAHSCAVRLNRPMSHMKRSIDDG